MFTDEQPPDYSFPLRFDVYPDDFLEIKSDATFDDDSFDSDGEKIKEAEFLIDPLDLPCDILSEYDSFNSQDFSRDDVLFYPDNKDKRPRYAWLIGTLVNVEEVVHMVTLVKEDAKPAPKYDSEGDEIVYEDEEKKNRLSRSFGILKLEIADVVQLQPYWSYADVCHLALKVEKQLKSQVRTIGNRFTPTNRATTPIGTPNAHMVTLVEEDAKPAPKYDSEGDEIVYQVQEVCLPDVGASLVI
uniref:Reverse transcriptase domain-containing protein n=1 Tax=Tanacetum cinerariifolium TaxID=118510 RepID=A0A6L2KWE9_TANCI|nr:reverse transcriptase domain-containing protein [Tanacetum cinerariifolium]